LCQATSNKARTCFLLFSPGLFVFDERTDTLQKSKKGSADIGTSNNKQLLPRVKCLLQLSKKKIHHFLQTENRKHTIWQKNQQLEVLARPTFLPLLRSIKTSNFFTFKKDRKKNFAKTYLMPNILDLTPLDFQRKNSSVPNISDNL
jgi:hypothetical protein